MRVRCLFAPFLALSVLPETIVCTQTQLYPWREQARGYLGRYPNQPLLVDPDLPEDPNRDGIGEFPGWGSFHSQSDYDITMREAKAMGIDGLALFAGRPSRFFKAGADCPVTDMLSLPIVCLWEKDVTNSFREIEVALKNPRAYACKGKFLLPSYWTAKYNTPEELKAKYDAIRAKYGDRFLFIAAVPTLSAQVVSYDRGGRVFSAAMTNHVETACRAYARVADGIQICEAHMQAKVERGERVFSETYWDTVHAIVRRVLDEPEFRGRKLLCSAAVNGHMNAYRGTYNTSEDCTRTLRASFETAIRYGADYIMLPEWDELNENTCYEPSLYGSRSVTRIVRHYMDLIRRRPHEALAGDDVAKPNLIVTYRKSLSPGEPLTVEVLNVPDGSRDGALSVAIELTDENGTVLRTFEPRTVDETKLQEERFLADTAELASRARAVRVRLLWKKGPAQGGTVFEGLHPVDLAPGNDWNHLCAKQAIRDLAEPTKAEVAWTDGRVRADLSCGEPIRYAMLCGNGCIQAIRGREGSDADRFREDGEHAVFQLTAYVRGDDLRVRKGQPPFSYAVKGVPGAEWYFIKEVSKGERFEFRTLRGDGYAPSVYLRVPKSALAERALLEADFGGKSAQIPLQTAFERKSYGVGVDDDLQFVATRFGLQARYPSVANAKAVSFDFATDRDRASMVYHLQFTTMSGKVWFSRPFVREDGGAARVRTRVWSGVRNAVVDVDLPAARVPVLAYDFAPDAGTVVAPKSGERHWYGVLGGPHSMATLWNRGCRTEGAIPTMTGGASDPDGSVPRRVREADGGWSLAFDGVGDYLSLPCGVTPAFSGFTVSFDVCPEKAVHPKKIASLYCSHGNLRNIGLKEDGELVLAFAGMSDARTVETRCRLEFGAWSKIKVTSTGDRLKLSVNGKSVGEYPIALPGHSASGTSVGGFPNWYDLCFFKGRLRNLVIDHRVSGIGLGASADLRDCRPSDRTRVLPRTVVVSQFQHYMVSEQPRGYLERYVDQPLAIDPDLPPDPDRTGIFEHTYWGRFSSQSNWEAAQRRADGYGIDGFAFFPGPERIRFWSAGMRSSVTNFLNLPIIGLWGKIDKDLEYFRLALENTLGHAFGGKTLVLSYWTEKFNSPEQLKAKLDVVKERFGDRFLFVPDISSIVGGQWKCRESDAARDRWAESLRRTLRAYLRVADGVYCGDTFGVFGNGPFRSERERQDPVVPGSDAQPLGRPFRCLAWLRACPSV